MTIQPNWLQNRTYSARLDRQIISSMFYEGVRTVSGLTVSQRGAGANMSVDVSAGEAFVDGDDQPNQGTYFVENDAVVNVAIGAAPGANSRIDLIVLQVRDPNAGGPAGDDAVIEVVTGTVAASPLAPDVPDSAIALAEVTVASGTAAITTAMIATRRTIAGRKAAAGTMELYSGPTSLIPNGWLVCDGAAETRATYPNLSALYELSGFPYGAGNGSTTFNKPDLRSRVPVASGTGFTTVGATGGAGTVTLSTANMPAHSHTVNSHSHTMSHTHPIDHNHAAFTTAAGGSHVHDSEGIIISYVVRTTGAGTAGLTTTDQDIGFLIPTTSAGSAHTHSIDVPNFTGTSGAASTSSTGSTAPGTSSVGSGTAVAIQNPYQVITTWLVCVG